jgi:hypothetical protein
MFLFLLDVITSAAFRITINVGTWVASKSMNGLYYAYNAVNKSENAPIIAPVVTTGPGRMIASGAGTLNSESEYVVITREEYDRLCGGQDYVERS